MLLLFRFRCWRFNRSYSRKGSHHFLLCLFSLLIVISIKIVLALVASFPTNLVSLNSESVCRSCVSFGVLKKAAAVLPLGGDVIFYYRYWERYYRGYFSGYFRSGPKTRLKSSGGRHGCIFLVPLASSSTATPSGSTVRSSGTTAPTVLLAFLPPRFCVSKGYYHPSGSTAPWSGSTARCGL